MNLEYNPDCICANCERKRNEILPDTCRSVLGFFNPRITPNIAFRRPGCSDGARDYLRIKRYGVWVKVDSTCRTQGDADRIACEKIRFDCEKLGISIFDWTPEQSYELQHMTGCPAALYGRFCPICKEAIRAAKEKEMEQQESLTLGRWEFEKKNDENSINVRTEVEFSDEPGKFQEVGGEDGRKVGLGT